MLFAAEVDVLVIVLAAAGVVKDVEFVVVVADAADAILLPRDNLNIST